MKLTLAIAVLSLVAVVALSAPIVESEPTLHKLLLDITLPRHLRDDRGLAGGNVPAARVKRGCRWCEELGKKVTESILIKLIDRTMDRTVGAFDLDGGISAPDTSSTKDELEKLALLTRVADGDDEELVNEKGFLGGVVSGLVGEIM